MSRRSAKQRCLWISFNVFPVRLRLSLVEIGKEFCLIVGKRTRNRRTSYTYERRERVFLLRDSFYLISTLFIITFSLFPSRSRNLSTSGVPTNQAVESRECCFPQRVISSPFLPRLIETQKWLKSKREIEVWNVSSRTQYWTRSSNERCYVS